MPGMTIVEGGWEKINSIIDAIESAANAGLMGNRSAALADIKAAVYELRETLRNEVTVCGDNVA